MHLRCFAQSPVRRWRLWPLLLLLPLLANVLPYAQVAAQSAPGQPPTEQVGAASPNGPEDGELDVFADWVTDYSATGNSNLSQTDNDAEGIVSKLKACQNSSRRAVRGSAYGNGAAWETDWKGEGLGGSNSLWVDANDLAYFSGHGDPNGIYFGTFHNDPYLRHTDAPNAWGDGDAEWVAFSACETMSADTPLRRWSDTMDGLHLILGFKTLMADVAYGVPFGDKLCAGNTLTQAWFSAADQLLPYWQTPRVLAEEYYQFDDRLEDHTDPDPNDDTYHTRSYTRSSSFASLQSAATAGAAPGDTMPLLPTLPLSDTEAHVQLEKLGAIFGIDVEQGFVQAAADSAANTVFQSEDGKFEFDLVSGLFIYHNTDRLWATPSQVQATEAAAPSAPVHVSQVEARAIADQFLRDHQLLPADARFTAVDVEQIESWQEAADLNQPDTLLTVDDVGYKVIYSRVVTATADAGAKEQTAQEFPVVGPGPKLLVYVDAQVPAGLTAAQQAQSAVIGVVGGYRRVAPATLGGAAADVPILNQAQIEALFNELEPIVALAYTPALSESRRIRTSTLSYYERPLGRAQDQLIPVYTLDVEYTQAENATSEGLVYIPANPAYMAPLAQITTSLPSGAAVAPGESLVLQASDAAAKLSDLGFSPVLTFTLGTGKPESYTYTWYLNMVAPENKLGEGRTLTYMPGAASSAKPEGIAPQTIVLEVRDTQATLSPGVSTTSFQVNQLPSIYLPLVNR